MSSPTLRNCDVIHMCHDLASETLVAKEIQSMYGSKSCNSESLRLKVHHTLQRFKKKKKNKSKDAESFLLQEFTLPVDRTELEFPSISAKEKKKIEELKNDVKSVVKENKILKRHLPDANALQCELQLKEEQICELQSELQDTHERFRRTLEIWSTQGCKNENETALNQMKECLDQKEVQINALTSELQITKRKLSSRNVRNVNKKLKRKDARLSEALQKLTESKEKSLLFQTKVQELKDDKIKLRKRVHYLNTKLSTVTVDGTDGKRALEEEINVLSRRVENLEKDNKQIQQLVDVLDSPEVVTFQDGRYIDEVREVIMDILSLNVSMNKINEVIRIVLRKLAGRDCSRLPSNGTKSQILLEARHLAYVQVAEAMLEKQPQEILGNCLHGDGTSKYHRHYQNFQVTTASGDVLTMSLQEMGGSDTASIMKAFRDTIDQLAEVIERGEQVGDVPAKLIASITNTMSDQGPTNPTFNRQLELLRHEMLPKAVENWSTLSDSSRSSMMNMAHFWCKMHLIVNFATECDKGLKSYEKLAFTYQPQFSFDSGESGAVRLVRTACKACHPHGSEEAGVASHFDTFLKGRNKKMQLVSFRGNRVNIIFYNSGALFYHREDLADFLSQWPSPNRLLKAVNEDLSQKVHLAGVRALGIIDKIITGPFWRLLEESPDILHLNPHLYQMKLQLEKWSKDSSGLLDGSETLLPTDVASIHTDLIYEALFADTGDVELDTLTQEALEIAMTSLLLILERQAQDQLPGGKYWEPSESLKKSTSNVPTTNVVSERDFAILDMLLRQKPNATTLALESLTMWLNNNTHKWLESLGTEKKSDLLREAREGATAAREKFQARKQQLLEQKKKKLILKQTEKANLEAKQHCRKIEITNNIATTGSVWMTPDDMEVALSGKTDKTKKDLLVKQLKFQKHVLKAKGNPNLFYFSHKGHQLSSDELQANLKQVLELNCTRTIDETTTVTLTPTQDRKTSVSSLKENLARKLKDAREKRSATNSSEHLPVYMNHPEFLVGKRIKHKCVEVDDTIPAWYDARVIRITKNNNNNVIKTMYCIVYDEDSDNEWEFDLLRDLQKKDLIILE